MMLVTIALALATLGAVGGYLSSATHAQTPLASAGTITLARSADLTPTLYLPLVVNNYSRRIYSTTLAYQGAFVYPSGDEWAYSGHALAYYPGGDPAGPDDGFPGSLFGTGHNWNQSVSEISIPAPVLSPAKNPEELNTATTLQPFQDIRGDTIDWPLEQARVGLEYLPPQGAQESGKLYCCWAQHLDEGATGPTHS